MNAIAPGATLPIRLLTAAVLFILLFALIDFGAIAGRERNPVLEEGGGRHWIDQRSGTSARFRGVCAVNSNVVWASGANGTYALTTDGGKTWKSAVVPGAEALDFRDVEAFSSNVAYLMSIGSGETSRVYKTEDGGQHWRLQLTNRNSRAFYDSIAFWDAANGLVISDPVDSRFIMLRTTDGGASWNEIAKEKIPPAIAGEACFAASGTCLTVGGLKNAWFASGGGAARVFRSTDRGDSWSVVTTPVLSDGDSSGIFSIAFRDAMNGLIVGGDYKKEGEARLNVARTTDGGRSWVTVQGLTGYRSCVAYLPGKRGEVIAVGPSGTDYSTDDGMSWRRMSDDGFHSVSFAKIGAGFGVGEKGRVAAFASDR